MPLTVTVTVTGDNGPMASINKEVAALLREYAELLGLTGGDPFRARNYEKAAKSVGGYPDNIGAIPDPALTKVPGVGSSIAAKIAEYRRTGTIKAVDELRAKVPPGALCVASVQTETPDSQTYEPESAASSPVTDRRRVLARRSAQTTSRHNDYPRMLAVCPSSNCGLRLNFLGNG